MCAVLSQAVALRVLGDQPVQLGLHRVHVVGVGNVSVHDARVLGDDLRGRAWQPAVGVEACVAAYHHAAVLRACQEERDVHGIAFCDGFLCLEEVDAVQLPELTEGPDAKVLLYVLPGQLAVFAHEVEGPVFLAALYVAVGGEAGAVSEITVLLPGGLQLA